MSDLETEPLPVTKRAELLRGLFQPIDTLRHRLVKLRVDTVDIDRLVKKVQVARFEALHRNAEDCSETCNAQGSNTSPGAQKGPASGA